MGSGTEAESREAATVRVQVMRLATERETQFHSVAEADARVKKDSRSNYKTLICARRMCGEGRAAGQRPAAKQEVKWPVLSFV